MNKSNPKDIVFLYELGANREGGGLNKFLHLKGVHGGLLEKKAYMRGRA
jgi:hypothetical protein